jgi:hypothetical protein
MEPIELKAKLMEEINLLPASKLSELYHLIHSFRLNSEPNKKKKERILRFSGCWQDMVEDDFKAFSKEILIRRQQAFSKRKNRESSTN